MTSDRPEPDIKTSIYIARPPEDVWKYVAEVSTDTEWREDVNEARWVSDPPYGIGSKGLHIIKGIGDWPWTTTLLDQPRVMAWVVTGGRFEGSHGAYVIEPEGNGCRFSMETRMKRTVILNLAMLFLKGRIGRQNVIDLEKLKAILEP